ncbi:MAG TPA: BON domain-containing protein [Blastocatellia bacterium]|nr:BON domain-containing protein [Blastocatellia bacterium]
MFRLPIAALTLSAMALTAAPAGSVPQKKERRELSEKQSRTSSDARVVSHLVKDIRRELVMLPYYGVFDWLEGEVRPDGTVVLRGQVIKPTTKSEAEARVKSVEGVEQVTSEIEVLPLSPNDDRLRLALYRTLFDWNSPLFRYATQAVPPIHIIVRNGRVVLRGVVASKFDSDLANTKANSVSGVFEVRNELKIEDSKAR